MSRQLLLAAVAAIPLTACDPDMDKPTTTPTTTQQTWLCGREYTNHAWGYQRYGTVLDTAGNIWRYKVERAPAGQAKPWDPKDFAMLTEEELKMRYDGAMVVSGKKVPVPEIEKYMPLIDDAARAAPTQPTPRGADMGQTMLYCLKYDASSRTYAQVMLDNTGDMVSTNPSQAAKNLTSWLNSWLGDVN